MGQPALDSFGQVCPTCLFNLIPNFALHITLIQILRQVSWIFFSLAAAADYAALPSASFTDYSALYAPDVRYKILWIFVTHCGARDVTGSLAPWARLRPTENPSRSPGFHPYGNSLLFKRMGGTYCYNRIF